MSNRVIQTLQDTINDTSLTLVKGTKAYKLQDANLPVDLGVIYFNSVLAKLKATALAEKTATNAGPTPAREI